MLYDIDFFVWLYFHVANTRQVDLRKRTYHLCHEKCRAKTVNGIEVHSDLQFRAIPDESRNYREYS